MATIVPNALQVRALPTGYPSQVPLSGPVVRDSQ
jgi:hypothetical protein